MIRDVAHQLEMLHIQLGPHGRLVGMALLELHVFLPGIVICQAGGDLEGIPDLPAVPSALAFGVAHELAHGKGHDLLLVYVELLVTRREATLFFDGLEALDVHEPDVAGLHLGERGVVELEVDARLEGLIERAGAVGREEEDAVVVFQDAEEDLRGMG